MLDFFVLVVVVSASGALSPGPLFLATIQSSMRAGRFAGLAVAAGHMAFELPLVMAIGLGVWNFVSDPLIWRAVGLLGACALITFGFIQLWASIKSLRAGFSEVCVKGASRSRIREAGDPGLFTAFLTGLTFTALNPYFIMWWFTVGLTLISEALRYGAIYGILQMFGFHIWLDYAWLGLTGYAAAVGGKLLSGRHVNLVATALALAIIGLGVWMLEAAATAL